MEFFIGLGIGFVVGIAFAAYRLKGSRTWKETGVVIFGGGGPGSGGTPK
jgi:hypothetical protein